MTAFPPRLSSRRNVLNSHAFLYYSFHIFVYIKGGGTTWDGTITKLLMKGCLFHHETSFQDWFYDDLKPWVHYIPVQWDLSDLHDRYLWAEDHPQECQAISERATEFAKHLLSGSYMSQLWNDLFGDYLGEAVRAFDAQGMDWPSMLWHYKHRGHIRLDQIARCGERICTMEVEEGKYIDRYSDTAMEEESTP